MSTELNLENDLGHICTMGDDHNGETVVLLYGS